jgi:two-component system response regulator YesN
METLYIADDEKIIRDGLKFILDWEELGFEICGEAGNGDEALEGILRLSPTVTMMDIKMPGLSGLEVIKKAREAGYEGRFIILSGYSDFAYAREAMKYDVNFYLTKPIDENELGKAIAEIKTSVEEARSIKSRNEMIRKKSKKEIIKDIVSEHADLDTIDIDELGLGANVYRVVAYENFDVTDPSVLPYQFSDLFMAANKGDELFEQFEYKHISCLLLKGSLAIEKLRRFVAHYDDEPEKGSPLDTLFIAYGCEVTGLSEISKSFDQARLLIHRRFFCSQGQHVLGFEDLPSVQNNLVKLEKNKVNTYGRNLIGYIQAFNRRKVAEELYALEEYLYHVSADISEVKIFLADINLQIKENISHSYPGADLPFESNTEIMGFIETRNYLYEIIGYFSNEFEKVMSGIGNSSRDSVMDDILYYIEHNYHTNLRLETISSLFGYNSSYLGKIFNKTVGESFNTYADKVRIKKAQELLERKELKVYEIAERVGYKNVDYFHKKFRKYVGQSPAEYRKAINVDTEEE